MKRLALFFLIIIVVLLAMVFTVLNTTSVAVDVYFYQTTIPVSVLIFTSILLGAVLGVFASVGLSLRHRAEIRKLRKQLALSEQEVVNLRKIPLKETD